MMKDVFSIEGSIEVILEDKYGVVKQREVHKNNMTDGFRRYTMYDMFNHGTLSNLLGTAVGKSYNALDRGVPSAFGIYALNDVIDIKPETFAPPYVDGSRKGLNSNVVFYNVEGATAETNQVMIPFLPRCYYDNAAKEVVIEYRKDTYAGTIMSVCIGRSHAVQETMYSVPMKDPNAPSDWFSYLANCLLEHSKDNGTTIYKTASATLQASFNCKTKEMKTYSVAAMNTNIGATVTTGQFNGLIIKDTIFKVARKSASGTVYTATLTYIKDWKNSTTSATKEIVFATTNDVPVNTVAYHPVLVHNTDTDMLEMFITVSTGDHSGKLGCSIKKAVIDPVTLDYEIIDLGIHNFGVGNFTTNTIHTYVVGTYYDGKYYLPLYHMYANGTLNVIATANWSEGIVIDKDFKDGIINFVPFRTHATTSTHVTVITNAGAQQCQINVIPAAYNFTTQVISGVNLDNPITKTADDLLRIIYRYKMN